MKEVTTYGVIVVGVARGRAEFMLLDPPTKNLIIAALSAEAERCKVLACGNPRTVDTDHYTGVADTHESLKEVVEHLSFGVNYPLDLDERLYVNVAGVEIGHIRVNAVRAWSDA